MFAIKVENVSKSYKIGQQKSSARYKTLQETITNIPGALFRKVTTESFLALNDISFEIMPGDRLGIIGRNGAGKSTLLKVLSRITEPSNGKVFINGRIASLLEVGTGFHPELTGRENVFMNGAILGMSRAEIKKKFDDIVDFAEVEKFIDTPVKRYSSGMYVRLAFAVAAHLETEILLVDEVLAVGDAQFQKKCLGKMENVSAKEGRTVLFVSHNMNAIEQLCSSILFLEKGKIKEHITNGVKKTIQKYLFNDDGKVNNNKWVNSGNEYENPYFQPLLFSVVDGEGKQIIGPICNDQEMWVEIIGKIQLLDPALTIGYAIYSEEGQLLYWSYQTDMAEKHWPVLIEGDNKLKSKIPIRFLNEGTYRIEFISSLHARQWLCEPGKTTLAIILNIQGGISDSPYVCGKPGLLAPMIPWIKI